MLAVLLGAFGAHALKAIYSEQQITWHQTAFEYHMYHALALMLVGTITSRSTEDSRITNQVNSGKIETSSKNLGNRTV